MPKSSKRRGKGQKNLEVFTGEEHDSLETASVASVLSSGSSCIDDVLPETEATVDESSSEELFEDKIKEAIDGLTEKSANTRVACLKSLVNGFRKKYCGDFLSSRRETAADAFRRCIRQGRAEERCTAADGLALLCLQLGSDEDTQTVFQMTQPTLKAVLTDASAPVKARASVAQCLAICQLLAWETSSEISDSMDVLHSVFSHSFLKGNGAAPQPGPDVTLLHAAALQGWALLLTAAPLPLVSHNADNFLSSLPELLHSSCVELRIAAGETIALMYELVRDEDEAYEGPLEAELCEHLRSLATESSKSKAKRDKKAQKSSFREVLRSVEEGDTVYDKVRFGSETLELEGWTQQRYYTALRSVLASGTAHHLQENPIVREMFGLGAPVIAARSKDSASRYQRHLYNSAVSKLRTQHRAKTRDKRTAVFE